LLSKHSGLAEFDFKGPSEEAIEDVTEGLFASFFGKGFDLHVVADDALVVAPVSTPQMQMVSATPGVNASAAMWPAPQPVGATGGTPAGPAAFLASPAPAPTLAPATLNVDLHKCIIDNMPFWKSAWAPVFELTSAVASGSESEVPEMSELMTSMMDVQLAMTRCKISPAMEAVLLDSIKAGKLHASLETPEGKFNNGDVPSLLASALEDFKDRQWYAFGSQLGVAMQDMLVVTFDQKYEADAVGNLRQRLPDMGRLANRRSLGVLALGAVSVGFLAMFALARSRRAVVAGVNFDRLDRAPVLLESDLEAIVE